MVNPIKVQTEDFTWKGGKIVSETYAKKEYTREEIRQNVHARSKALKNAFKGNKAGNDWKILVSIHFNGSNQWRSGSWSKLGEPVYLYDYSDSDYTFDEDDYIDQYTVYLWKEPKRAGGADNNNDCLFKVLKSCLGNSLPWTTPQKFKTFLKVKRDDPIDISLIPKIEKKLKNIKINITGDHIYTSTKDAKHEINILLQNGHYTYNNGNRLTVHGKSYKERIPLIYYKSSHESYIGYDGKEEKTYTNDEIKNIRKTPMTSKYVLIPTDDRKTPLKLQHEKFIQSADALKEATELTESWRKVKTSRINLYKTGTYANTALLLFESMTRTIYPEPILQDEAEWINNASSGPMIYAKSGYKGKGYKYDYVSRYPANMRRNVNFFPIKRGEFKKLTQEEFDKMQVFPMGIYRCVVEKKETKTFKYNEKNYYTGKDVFCAVKKGLKVKLIDDDKPNHLYYSPDKCIAGHQLFKEYVDYVYELKKKKIQGAKMILNILWGALCQQNKIHFTIMKGEEKREIGFDVDITNIYQKSDNITIVNAVSINNAFETNYARIKPFILADGRYMINTLIEPFEDDVVYVHTDGFIITKRLDIKTGSDIGELEYNGYDPKTEITNVTNYKFVENK